MRGPVALTAVAVAVAVTATACGGGYAATSTAPRDPLGATAPTAYQSEHRGGTLLVDSTAAAGTMDPQISYDTAPWQIAQALYDGLLAFRKVGGDRSLRIVPDLAVALPRVTDAGRTYTFRLRRGIRFSDGRPLRTDDVVASFRRIFRASGPTAGTFFADIRGADRCLRHPKTCTLPGVHADRATGTITINLTRADSEFPFKLALPHAAVLPASTPPHDQGIHPIPGTGAYRIASYNPNSHLVLTRNRYFHEWSRDAQPEGYPDRIDYRYGLTVDSEVTEVENGQADWVNDKLPGQRLNEIGTKYAGQVHIAPLPAMWYLPLNVNIPPFNRLQARQAVEWAVDRNAVILETGGAGLATPVCTILPPSYAEHVDYCPYTSGEHRTWHAPDLARARRLVRESGTAGQPVALVVSNDATNLAIGQYLQTVLTDIGYRATLKPLSNNIQFSYIQNSKNRVQISLTQWFEDYPAPSDFIDILLSCSSFHPGSDSSINMGGFCDHAFDARIARATAHQHSDPARARTEWAALDREAMDRALLVPLFTPRNIDLVSRRVGNYQFSTEFYLLVDQVWVR